MFNCKIIRIFFNKQTNTVENKVENIQIKIVENLSKFIDPMDFLNNISYYKNMKILLKLLCIFIICFLIFIFLFLLFYKDNKDYCLDSGICAENLQLNTKYGLITITEESCKKYNWKWNSKRRYCNVR